MMSGEEYRARYIPLQNNQNLIGDYNFNLYTYHTKRQRDVYYKEKDFGYQVQC
jgi:hypothetical protein